MAVVWNRKDPDLIPDNEENACPYCEARCSSKEAAS
jgi:hypothetical protein